jgi:hypothetical protein
LTAAPPNAKNYPPARHRTPGDIMSEHRATPSRNARATSSESAPSNLPCCLRSFAGAEARDSDLVQKLTLDCDPMLPFAIVRSQLGRLSKK